MAMVVVIYTAAGPTYKMAIYTAAVFNAKTFVGPKYKMVIHTADAFQCKNGYIHGSRAYKLNGYVHGSHFQYKNVYIHGCRAYI